MMFFFLSMMMTLAMMTTDQSLRPNPPGVLQVYVAISDDPEYIEDWEAPPPKQPVQIERLEELHWGETAYVGFVVTGYALNRDRRSDVEIDVKIIHPDGSVLFEQEAYAEMREGPLRKRGFVMADPGLDLPVNPGDPLGTYGILATAHDHVSNREATGGYSLMVKETSEEKQGPREENTRNTEDAQEED